MSDEIWIEERQQSEGSFENVEDGQHVAKIGGVWDTGLQKGYQDGPPKRKVSIAFELDERDSKGRRFTVFNAYALSLFEKAPLRHLLDALFPKEPKEKFNVRRVVGSDCLVTTARYKTQEGKERVKVTSVVALPKQMSSAKITTLEGDYSKPFGVAKSMIERQIKRPQTMAQSAIEDAPEVSPEAPPF